MSGLGQPLPHIAASGITYLDYNATTPIWPEVCAAMQPFQLEFGNPSSPYVFGRTTKAALEKARAQVASLINAQPHEIIFCSGGTEADNSAIWGAIAAAYRRMSSSGVLPHVVTSAIEHPAVLEKLASLQDIGLCEFTAVGVDSAGQVSVQDVAAALTDRTVLITIMHSNNEVGTIQPVQQIASLARERSILMHTDAAQSIGKVDVDVVSLGVDMMTIVGHKFGAPKGIGALFAKEGTSISNFLCGGGQERGARAGTENVMMAGGLGAAADIASRELNATKAHMSMLRDELQMLLTRDKPDGTFRVMGPHDPALRLPNTLSIAFKGIESSALLKGLSTQLAASAGSACHSHSSSVVSGVLWAMGVPHDWALGTLRLSVGRHSTMEDVKNAARLIQEEVHRQQRHD